MTTPLSLLPFRVLTGLSDCIRGRAVHDAPLPPLCTRHRRNYKRPEEAEETAAVESSLPWYAYGLSLRNSNGVNDGVAARELRKRTTFYL